MHILKNILPLAKGLLSCITKTDMLLVIQEPCPSMLIAINQTRAKNNSSCKNVVLS